MNNLSNKAVFGWNNYREMIIIYYSYVNKFCWFTNVFWAMNFFVSILSLLN